MAKKVAKQTGKLPDPFDMLKSIDDDIEVLNDSESTKIVNYTPSSNLLLNAAISGSLFKGIMWGRVTTLAGESGSGKSYLAANFVMNFIKQCKKEKEENPDAPDYAVLYLDSEGAIDDVFMTRLGIDTSKVAIKQVNTITEVSTILKNLCNKLKEQEDQYGTHTRFMCVLDSLGNLSSAAEINAIENNTGTRDMTKAAQVKQLFRVVATPMAKLHIPFIVVSHIYSSLSMYSPDVISGGSGLTYAGSTTLRLRKCKLEDKASAEAASKAAGKEQQVKDGIRVKAVMEKSRYTKPYIIEFQIPFYKAPNPYIGLEAFLSWEQGVCRGSAIDKKTYDKMSDSEKESVHVYEDTNKETGEVTTYYVQEKQTARGIYVKHLNRQVSFQEFFSPVVFTDEFLHYIDENIIQPTFNLPATEVDLAEDLEAAIEGLE